MSPNLAGLLKIAANSSNENKKKKARKNLSAAIIEYENDPTDKAKAELINALSVTEKLHPLHTPGGYFNTTRRQFRRASELYNRGNKVRGVLSSLALPFMAVSDVMSAPVRAISRSIDPSTNVGFDDPEDIVNRDDPEEVLRSAKELEKLYSTTIANPTDQLENITNMKNDLKASFSTTMGPYVSGLIASGGTSAIPYAAQGLSDFLSYPHTALFNKMNWNGSSRDDYEDLLIRKALSE